MKKLLVASGWWGVCVPLACGWAARKGFHFPAGGPGPPGPPRPPGNGKPMLARPAIGPRESTAAAPGHRPVRSPQAYSWREAPPRHNPGGLGGPGGPGSRLKSREAAWCLPPATDKLPGLAPTLATGPLPRHRPGAYPGELLARLLGHWQKKWSGRRESNPRKKHGKLLFCH